MSGVVVGVLLAVIVSAVVLCGVMIVVRETNTHHVQMAVENRKTLHGVMDRMPAMQPEPVALEPERPRVRWKHEPRRIESRRLDQDDLAELPPGVIVPGLEPLRFDPPDLTHDRVREEPW